MYPRNHHHSEPPDAPKERGAGIHGGITVITIAQIARNGNPIGRRVVLPHPLVIAVGRPTAIVGWDAIRSVWPFMPNDGPVGLIGIKTLCAVVGCKSERVEVEMTGGAAPESESNMLISIVCPIMSGVT